MQMQQLGKLKVYYKSFQIIENVVYYMIKVEEIDTNINWIIRTRYSHLRSLHFQLIKNYKGQLPNFPSKKWFGNLNREFINFRQKQLIAYINLILINIEKTKIDDLYQFLYSKVIDHNQIDSSLVDLQNISINKKDRFEKVKEDVNNRMIDLAYNIQPPDDAEIKSKQKQYVQIQLKIKQQNIPQHMSINISAITTNITTNKLVNESFYNKNESLVSHIDQKMVDLKRKINEMNNIISQNNMLVHLLE